MKILSILNGHDSNISTYDSETGEFTYTKHERLVNLKHMYGFDDLEGIISRYNPDYVYLIGSTPSTAEDYNFKLFQKYETLFDGILNEVKHGDYEGAYDAVLNAIPEIIKGGVSTDRIYCVQHHYAHILSSWPIGICEYGVAIDAGCEDFTNRMIVKNPFDIDNAEVLVRITQETATHKYDNIGLLLNHIAEKQLNIYSTLDSSGKVMGLQAYGEIDYSVFNVLDRIDNLGSSELLPYFPRMVYETSDIVSHIINVDGTFKQEGLNFITTAHQVWCDYIVELFTSHIPADSSVAYAGGTAQNTLANYDLLQIYDNLEVVPHCYDGGLSIGGIGFGMMQHNLPFPEKVEGFPYIQSDESTDIPSDETIKKVAKMLADGKIVGWYQGHGEAGPRALGNRSILMNAGATDGKEILNSRVKHREHWRPFAPSVLASEAHKWFEIDEGFESKYMLYAVQAKPSMSPMIPSVVHVDGSSRIQTVSEEDNIVFYKLLTEFHAITGIPMLLNTSLNKGGDPIMGKHSQVYEMLDTADLDAICIGDEIHYKKAPKS